MHLENFEEKTIKRNEIFKGKVIQVVVDEVRLPDGNVSERELVFHSGAVAIMAVDESQRMLFVTQYRKPLERVTLEIPAGKMEGDEAKTPLVTAKRELEEETAVQADSWQEVQGMYMTPGFSNEYVSFYWAEKLHKVSTPLKTDADEFLSVRKLTLSEAKQAIQTQEICDAKTIYAVMVWEQREQKKEEA